jgi:hypothetical protein
VFERVESGLVDLIEVVAAVDGVRQLKANGKWGRCGGQ